MAAVPRPRRATSVCSVMATRFAPPDAMPATADGDHQYAFTYRTRLAQLRTVLDGVVQEYIKHLPAGQRKPEPFRKGCPDVRMVLIGALVKIVPEPPKAKKNKPPPPPLPPSIELENGVLRVPLTFAAKSGLTIDHLVSGMIVAACGHEEKGTTTGAFCVDTVLHAGLAPLMAICRPPASKPLPSSSFQRRILFASGLDIGKCDPIWLHKLLEYARTDLSITRIVLAGNTSTRAPAEANAVATEWGVQYDAKQNQARAQHNTTCDQYLAQLAWLAPISLLPGDNDAAATAALPRRAFPACLFPLTNQRQSMLQRCTDPALIDTDGVAAIVTTGQAITDLLKRAPALSTPLVAMELTLQQRLLMPTAPDTLAACPLDLVDTSVLTETPHLYVVGNQPAYATSLLKGSGVRLMALPVFSQTAIIIVCDVWSPSFDCKAVTLS
jgi:DNA polymerase delta subunit 2